MWDELRAFGEMAVVKQHSAKFQAKIKKGMIVMMSGYAENHPKGTYRFLNIETKSIIMSRDVTWLNSYHGDHFNITQPERSIIEINPKFYQTYFELEDEETKPVDQEIQNLEYESKDIRDGKQEVCHNKMMKVP